MDGDNNEKDGDGGDEADAPGSDQDHRHGSDDNYEGGSRLQRMMMRGSARGESDLLMGLQEENDEEGFEAGSVISEVCVCMCTCVFKSWIQSFCRCSTTNRIVCCNGNLDARYYYGDAYFEDWVGRAR